MTALAMLIRNQIHEITDILQVRDLQCREANIEMTFHSDDEPDVIQAIPPINIVCDHFRGRVRDVVTEHISKYGAQLGV